MSALESLATYCAYIPRHSLPALRKAQIEDEQGRVTKNKTYLGRWGSAPPPSCEGFSPKGYSAHRREGGFPFFRPQGSNPRSDVVGAFARYKSAAQQHVLYVVKLINKARCQNQAATPQRFLLNPPIPIRHTICEICGCSAITPACNTEARSLGSANGLRLSTVVLRKG